MTGKMADTFPKKAGKKKDLESDPSSEAVKAARVKVFEKVEFAVYCGPEDEMNYQVFGKVLG